MQHNNAYILCYTHVCNVFISHIHTYMPMHEFLHLCIYMNNTLYSFDSHKNFVSADQNANRLSSYLQHAPSCKQFYPRYVKHVLSLLESKSPSSYVINFKVASKKATLQGLVTAKCCSDLTYLHVRLFFFSVMLLFDSGIWW